MSHQGDCKQQPYVAGRSSGIFLTTSDAATVRHQTSRPPPETANASCPSNWSEVFHARTRVRKLSAGDRSRLGTGLGGLSLPAILQARALADSNGQPSRKTAVIQYWLNGAASHFETYDPKPDAPSGFP
jgi:hypothetical protein